ncbi:MAG: OmpA family protein [Dissulfurispiraceae bacterium]|jgi:outer membrane protein OmpA-like peptidoglycan-associated protein
MMQKELNEENKEIKRKAHEIIEKHGFKDGDDFVDWIESERQTGTRSRAKRAKQMQHVLLAVVGILCIVVLILSIMLFRRSPNMELSAKSLSDLKVMMELSEKNLAAISELKVMMLVLDKKADEEVVVFGDTHFNYNKSTLTNEAKALLDRDVQLLAENPKMKVRMAGYTSAKGTEESNQKLSEGRANSVRDYLIEKGIAPERITIIGYGRTRPALFEVSPLAINTKEAKANMRVLFEVVVK